MVSRVRHRLWRGGVCALATVACVLLCVNAAHAHLVSTDLGPFYDGAAHPVVSPEDLLTLVGFAILAGWAGTAVGRRLLGTLTLSWMAGVLVGFLLAPSQWDAPLLTSVVLLLLGLLGAFRVVAPAQILVLGAGLVGVGRGVLNGSAIRAADGPWLAVLGLVTGVFLVGALLTGSSAWLRKRRAAVLLRVVASWVAAIGLLMLGWQLRG